MNQYDNIVTPSAGFSHLPWISFVLLLAAFALFASSLKSAGVDLSAQSGALKELPLGVSGYTGLANRLLFATSYLWVALASLSILKSGAFK